jgi:hypothetical protein
MNRRRIELDECDCLLSLPAHSHHLLRWTTSCMGDNIYLGDRSMAFLHTMAHAVAMAAGTAGSSFTPDP